jgi:hypothetical protein
MEERGQIAAAIYSNYNHGFNETIKNELLPSTLLFQTRISLFVHQKFEIVARSRTSMVTSQLWLFDA